MKCKESTNMASKPKTARVRFALTHKEVVLIVAALRTVDSSDENDITESDSARSHALESESLAQRIIDRWNAAVGHHSRMDS
jgi:hypothetical protein